MNVQVHRGIFTHSQVYQGSVKVPVPLSVAFGPEFEQQLEDFVRAQELIPVDTTLQSPRFLARSIVPHVQKLSDRFNRTERLVAAETDDEGPRQPRSRKEVAEAQEAGLAPYWKESSNPANLRLAYFLYFMPPNLYRVASIWAELKRLGFQWKGGSQVDGIEFGAGPASGACGIAAGEAHAPCGLPEDGVWALIEQDKAILELGGDWAENYFASTKQNWTTRRFHRAIDWSRGLLPPTAPRFNLWVMSYFLNESMVDQEEIADHLLNTFKKHLAEEGVVIFCEPALKMQSRRLLDLRRRLLEKIGPDPQAYGLQILTPCLGAQACGAFAAPEDWCHEEVSWWRPPYFKKIDEMAGLDRKTLPFSYLVLTKSKRPIQEILPALRGSKPDQRQRLVSPSHDEGQDLEFYICGQNGKRRARYRPDPSLNGSRELGRGDLLLEAEIRGDSRNSRIDRVSAILTDPDGE